MGKERFLIDWLYKAVPIRDINIHKGATPPFNDYARLSNNNSGVGREWEYAGGTGGWMDISGEMMGNLS